MRDRVRFMIDSTTPDTIDPVFDQLFIGQVPCEVHDKTGGERFRGKQLQAETTHVLELRWIEGLKTNMVAVNESTNETYLINRILRENARNRFVLIEAIEADG